MKEFNAELFYVDLLENVVLVRLFQLLLFHTSSKEVVMKLVLGVIEYIKKKLSFDFDQISVVNLLDNLF